MSLKCKRRVTNKLHYKKYLYKINLFNELGFIFRGDFNNRSDERFPFAKQKLDEYQQTIDMGDKILVGRFRSRKILPEEELADAKKLYYILCKYNDLKIRIEYFYGMWVYTNDRELLTELLNEVPNCVVEYWDVDEETKNLLRKNENIVLKKTPQEYDYKVYLNNNVKKYTEIADWLRKNNDKSKIGDKTLECLERAWITNNYFYIKNEKVLLLLQMIGSESIGRIERLVYEGDVDKYTYELNK